jgi:hypothetical protein
MKRGSTCRNPAGQALGALAGDTTTFEAERAIHFLVGAQMNWGKLAGRVSKEVPNGRG